ncbi:hypothetical protein F4803DRAFT_543467 [Xylaria telfairii]|nr:hypothetical protein F4803DRAFT_543467 [Xylaria telfairii]
MNPQTVDKRADWNIPLIADEAGDAGFRIKDAPGGEPHRLLMTGYDRPNATAVRGRLFHVVHGAMGNRNKKPATLIVFEWEFVPGRLGLRFKEVEIDVTFVACGSRPGELLDADLSGYTPHVRAVMPNVPIKSYISPRAVTEEKGKKLALGLGYAPFFSLNPEGSTKSIEVTNRTDYRFVAGYSTLVGRNWGDPDSVHWTLQENAPQQSGIPHRVRTAVLLEREAGDYGTFSATVKTRAHVSFTTDTGEALRRAVGLVPKDDPVSFDPKSTKGVHHGAAVLFGSKEVSSTQESPCNKKNLGAEDLAKFMIADDGVGRGTASVANINNISEVADGCGGEEGASSSFVMGLQ